MADVDEPNDEPNRSGGSGELRLPCGGATHVVRWRGRERLELVDHDVAAEAAVAALGAGRHRPPCVVLRDLWEAPPLGVDFRLLTVVLAPHLLSDDAIAEVDRKIGRSTRNPAGTAPPRLLRYRRATAAARLLLDLPSEAQRALAWRYLEHPPADDVHAVDSRCRAGEHVALLVRRLVARSLPAASGITSVTVAKAGSEPVVRRVAWQDGLDLVVPSRWLLDVHRHGRTLTEDGDVVVGLTADGDAVLLSAVLERVVDQRPAGGATSSA